MINKKFKVSKNKKLISACLQASRVRTARLCSLPALGSFAPRCLVHHLPALGSFAPRCSVHHLPALGTGSIKLFREGFPFSWPARRDLVKRSLRAEAVCSQTQSKDTQFHNTFQIFTEIFSVNPKVFCDQFVD